MARPAIILAALLMLVPAVAQAQPRCAPRASVVAQLEGVYLEAPIVSAVSDVGLLIETWASALGETWTLLVTRPDGFTCVMALGRDLIVGPLPIALPEPAKRKGT